MKFCDLSHIFFAALLVLVFSALSCRKVTNEPIRYEYSLIPLEQKMTDSNITNIILPYKKKLDDYVGAVLAESEMEMRLGGVESLLGNFVADLVLTETNTLLEADGKPLADISLLNNGGLRASINPGEITIGQVYELMPFENTIVIVEMPANKIEKLCAHIAKVNGQPVSGLRMEISNSEPRNIVINGEAFNDKKTYRVATSDYLANKGDGMSFFEGEKIEELGVSLRDMIIGHLEKAAQNEKPIRSMLDGRIRVVE